MILVAHTYCVVQNHRHSFSGLEIFDGLIQEISVITIHSGFSRFIFGMTCHDFELLKDQCYLTTN